jgi:signal transduction histidine kinase
LALTATVIFILWQLYLLRVRHLVQVERLRSKIASDLHDDVGSMLTRIFQGSEIVQISKDPEKINRTAQRIGQLTREATQLFSDIIWSIEAQNDTIGNLIDRMQDTCYKLLDYPEVKIDFEIRGLNRDKALEGSKRQHIYLIFKEAIHNIAKYAQAHRVVVRLINEKRHFVMEIQDDGIGMADNIRNEGHGLRSMQRRSAQLKGKLDILVKKGVTIRLKTEKL